MLTRENVPWKWTQEEEDAFQLKLFNQSTNLTLSGRYPVLFIQMRKDMV